MAAIEVSVAPDTPANFNGRGSAGATDSTVDFAVVGKHLSSTLITITQARIDEYIARTGDNHPCVFPPHAPRSRESLPARDTMGTNVRWWGY